MRGSLTSVRRKLITSGCGRCPPGVPAVLRLLDVPTSQAAPLVTRRAPWQNLRIPDCVQPCSHDGPSTCVEFSKPGSIGIERPRVRVSGLRIPRWPAGAPEWRYRRGCAGRPIGHLPAPSAPSDEVELSLASYPSPGGDFARKLRHGARSRRRPRCDRLAVRWRDRRAARLSPVRWSRPRAGCTRSPSWSPMPGSPPS